MKFTIPAFLNSQNIIVVIIIVIPTSEEVSISHVHPEDSLTAIFKHLSTAVSKW
jgi:hypothetical protein